MLLSAHLLVGVRRFRNIGAKSVTRLGQVVKRRGIAVQGICSARTRLCPHETSFVKDAGGVRFLGSCKKGQHFLIVPMGAVSCRAPMSRGKICTRTIRLVRSNFHC